ncbi:MAG: hypothetical protein ACREB0_10600 [Sphingopyxis sp.]
MDAWLIAVLVVVAALVIITAIAVVMRRSKRGRLLISQSAPETTGRAQKGDRR